MKMSKPIQANQEKIHIPVTLPEPLGNHFLKKRAVRLGFKECTVKYYVTIQRCHKCLDFDHVAVFCQKHQICSLCASDHIYAECRAKKGSCHVCLKYNYNNRGLLTAPKHTDHPTNSGHCGVYRMFLQIRQMELNQIRKQLTAAADFMERQVDISTITSRSRIAFRKRDELNRLQKKKKQIRQIWTLKPQTQEITSIHRMHLM